MELVTDAQACAWLTNQLEAVLSRHRYPILLQTEPYGAHAYRAIVAGRVPNDLATLILRATRAARLTIQHEGNQSVIILE